MRDQPDDDLPRARHPPRVAKLLEDGRLSEHSRRDEGRAADLQLQWDGQDRLLFKGAGGLAVRDYNGKVLRTLRGQEQGWGVRIAHSEDGNRLLFDSLTRHVGLVQSMKEKALVLPTMGMSADGEVPNGEMVRVIDTGSGRQCFEWKGKTTLLPLFGSHADIDPSGRLVAIVTHETLAIYRLPGECAVPQTDER